MEKLSCTSCKKLVAVIQGSAKFMCPNCGKHLLVRCGECRKMAAKYSCPECGFEGPN
ncbi:MAG: zinc finger domain-containing protein [Candidatus Pacearchaeota archaeon]